MECAAADPVPAAGAGNELGLHQRLTVIFIQNVLELGRVKDLTASLALDKFHVILTGDDAYLRMFARRGHREWAFAGVDLPKSLHPPLALVNLLSA